MTDIDALLALLPPHEDGLDGAPNFVAIIGASQAKDSSAWIAAAEAFAAFGIDAKAYRCLDHGDRWMIEVWFSQLAAKAAGDFYRRRLEELDRPTSIRE